MRVVSVNVGLPREVLWKGKRVSTGIFKSPVEGRVAVRTLNLAGDRQADLSVHGGRSKAVYAYPAEHYPVWRAELGVEDLPWGSFGENLTVEGLSEKTTMIGDRLRVGTATLRVTEPRLPCFKLGLRFGRDDVIKRFLEGDRSGFYMAVVSEGEVEAGDAIELVGTQAAPERPASGVTVADVARLYTREKDNLELLRRAVEVEALPLSWRSHFRRRIEDLGG